MTEKNNWQYFKYVLKFMDKCSNDISDKCAETVLDERKINKNHVNKCMNRVIDGKSDLLDKDRAYQ